MRLGAALVLLCAALTPAGAVELVPRKAPQKQKFRERLPAAVVRETFSMLGWNKGCSVAVGLYGFPTLGEALVGDPVFTRIGSYTIRPGEVNARESWLMARDGERTWDPQEAEAAKAKIKEMGYALPGLSETVRPDPVAQGRGLEEILLTTAAFQTKAGSGWPERGYRLGFVYYSPLGTCALLVYDKDLDSGALFQPMLVKVDNPGVRQKRAHAHVLNGLLLWENSDGQGALAETAIAAKMAPDYALARYHHGTMLNLSGSAEAALDELSAAVKLDPKYREKARKDKDWDAVSDTPRFKELSRH